MDCPYKGQGYEQRDYAGGSGGGQSQSLQQPHQHQHQGTPSKATKGKEKGDNPGKGKTKKGKDGGKGKGKDKVEKEGDKPAVKAVVADQESKEHQETASASADREMMQEVTSLLRSLRVEPRLNAFRIMKVGAAEEKVVLLDGGATHCLRQARSQEEWESASPTMVQLAAGSVTMRMHPEVGTLLSQEMVQPIIPVSKMTEVGYKVVWTQDQCCFEHPKNGTLPTALQQGCPVVSMKIGMNIMREVEEAQRRKAKIRSILACGMLAEDDEGKKAAALKSEYPDVPDRILERALGLQQWDGHMLPMNRRARRRVERAASVVVHVFSGPNPQPWVKLETDGTAVVCLDILRGADIHDGHLSGWLDQLVDSGNVKMWIAGPPCRTVSVCRQREDDGPRTLRARHGNGRFGLPTLSESEQALADDDAVLWIKNLRWIEKARRSYPQLQVMLEQPHDPMERGSRSIQAS